jgi:hypothetical protein
VVEQLPSKHEALSSNPSTTKRDRVEGKEGRKITEHQMPGLTVQKQETVLASLFSLVWMDEWCIKTFIQSLGYSGN